MAKTRRRTGGLLGVVDQASQIIPLIQTGFGCSLLLMSWWDIDMLLPTLKLEAAMTVTASLFVRSHEQGDRSPAPFWKDCALEATR